MKKSTGSFWLVKQEPEDYAWSVLVRDGRTAWTGVRNFLARNHLRAMSPGDRVLYYHSGSGKEVVGVAEVVRGAYPDPTAGADAGDWSCVDLAPVEPLPNPVTLARIKADPLLSKMMFVRQSRLSVSAVTPEEFARVLALSRSPASPSAA